MAKEKKSKHHGLFGRGKKRLVLLAMLIVLVPTVGLADYTAQSTIAAQKVNQKASQEASKHPIKYLLGALSAGSNALTKAVNPKAKTHKGPGYSTFVKANSAKRRAVFGLGAAAKQQMELQKLKNINPKAYNKLVKQMKKGKVKPGTPAGNKKIEAILDKNDPEYAKQTAAANDQENAQEAKDESNMSSSGNSSFKSKIAEALLHVFWSKGLGKWVMQNGATGTVFTYNALEDQKWGDIEDAQVSQQLSDKVNNHPSLLMFPASSYSSKMATAIDAMRPPMMAFAAVMLVAAVIVGGMQLGIGSAFQAASGRLAAYRTLTDVVISVAAVASIPMFIRMLLQIDGALLELFANYMESVPVGKGTLMTVALQMGADESSLKVLTKGSWLGSGFAAVIFIIIYLCTAIGIAIWVKYYYFVRMIAFIILMILGPVFIAMWPFGIGKSRTLNWLRDVVGTIFIQPIHAFVLTLMATLLAINSDTFGSLVTKAASGGDKSKADVAAANSATTTDQLNAAMGKVAGLDNSSMTIASNFEMIIMGFIVLILFQPVSKSIAGLLGIGSNMLDNVRGSTSRTLMTGAAIAGTAAVGLGAGALAGGSSLAHGANAALNAAKATRLQKGMKNAGARTLARRQAMAKDAHLKSANEMRKAMQARARAKGLLGTNAGRLAGGAIGAGTGNMWAMTGLSAAGGEIGRRAAELNTTGEGLLALGLKKANAWRRQNAQAHDARTITGATMNSLNAAARSRTDMNTGPLDEITDQVTNNSKLSPADKTAGLANAKAFSQAAGDFVPNDQAKAARVQNEMRKDRTGNYIPNSEVQQMSRGIINGLTDGKVYDSTHNGPPKSYKDLQEKAEAVGFDLPSWEAANPKSGNLIDAPARLRAANDAMNSIKTDLISATQQAAGIGGAATDDLKVPVSTNELARAAQNATNKYNRGLAANFATPEEFAAFQKTSEYRSGLKKAQDSAKQAAYANSNGGVLLHTDMAGNKAFNNSIIDGGRYNDELSNQLDNLHIKPDIKHQLLGVTHGIDGSDMIQDVPIGHGNSAKVINQDLFDQMEQQRAYSLRSQGFTNSAGKPVTRADMASVYSPDVLSDQTGQFGTAQEYRDYFSGQNRQGYADYNQAAQDWAKLRNETALGAGDSPRNYQRLGSALSSFSPGLGGNGNYGPSSSGEGMLSSPSGSNPYAEGANASSLSMDEVRKMVPIVKNDRGEPVGTSPGSIRVLYGNNYSMLQARDPDGAYHQVGILGPGDGSLGANDVAYQDADLTPTGDLVMRMDPHTHRPSTPYRMSGDTRIPVSLPGGTADLGQFFAPDSYSNRSTIPRGPYAKSEYMGMDNAPELQRALENDGHVYGDNYSGYHDIRVRGTYDGMVMTGRDPRDGQQKVMSRVYDNSIWNNMENGYEFSIPVKESNGEFRIDESKPLDVTAASGTTVEPTRLENMKQELQILCRSNEGGIQNTINDVILKPTKPNSRAFKYQNQPGYSVSGLKPFTD